jgi:putative transposase
MRKRAESDRAIAVQRFLRGERVSSIARSLGYSRKWIYKWIQRQQAESGDAAWYQDRPCDPHACPRRLPGEMVEIVKLARLHLYNRDLFCGAQAIQWELRQWEVQRLPSLRTINRILSREGLTHRRTGRYESQGRKYPSLVGETANAVHQMDFVGPCYLRGPLRFYSLNSVDLATGRCAINPVLNKAAQPTLDAIWAGWCRLGIPQHQQVDNELVFYGSRQHPRGMGPLIRLCLLYDVQPWFIPMAEPWRNGVVEKFNDHYQKGLLRRMLMESVEDLRQESLLFEQKHNAQYRYT